MSTWIHVIITLYTIIESNTAKQIIDTNTAKQYQNGEIHCNGNEDCQIICDEEQSCENTDIYCPSNGNYLCEVQCLSSNSCHTSFIDCSSSIDCIVTCDGESACDSATIKWPTNNNGSLVCNGEYSCSHTNFPIPPPDQNYIVDTCDGSKECTYATFTCPLNADCNIKCMNEKSCHYATIIWSLNNPSINSVITAPNKPCEYCTRPPIYPPDDTTNYYLTCTEQTCFEGVVYCPKYAECHITCNGAFSCFGTAFIWPETHLYTLNCVDTSSCQGLIYTPYNNNQPLSLENVQGNDQKIHCPSDAECDIECNGMSACQGLIVNCPSNSQCNVICTDYLSCQYAVFNGIGTVSSCSGSGSCQEMHFPQPPPNIDYVLRCGDSVSCKGSTIRCPQNADCNITCSATESCQDANIIWSTNGAVSSQLSCGIAVDACLNVNGPPINYQSGVDNWTDYYLDCNGNAQCANSIISCPSSAMCNITCSATDSCKNTVINGGNDELTIICSGVGSCYSTEIYAETVSLLTINDCTATDSCTSMMVWFPPYIASNNPRAIIDGITDIGLTEVIFYAVNGWEDILITNYMYDTYGIINHVGHMFCGSDYHIYCDFAINGWQCHPYGDIRCDSIPTALNQTDTSNPTPSPIVIPTRSPITTNDPTPSPTNNPIPSPTTNAPTDSTDNPTPAPTNNPTPAPTEDPTPAPTHNPTPSPTNDPSSSVSATNSPTPSPTDNPTPSPTDNPTSSPTNDPSSSSMHTPTPSTTNQPIKSTMITTKNQDREGEAGHDISTTIINKSGQDETASSNAFGDASSIKKIIIILLFAILIIICCIVVRWRCVKRKRQRRAKMIQAAMQHININPLPTLTLQTVASNSVVSINDGDGQSTPYTAMTEQNGAICTSNGMVELEMEGGLSSKRNRELLMESTQSTDNKDDINDMNNGVEGNAITDIAINPMQGNGDANSDEEDNYMGNRKVTKGNDYAEPMSFDANRNVTASNDDYNGGHAVPHHMNGNRKVTAGNDYNGVQTMPQAMPQEVDGVTAMGPSDKKMVMAPFDNNNNNDAYSDDGDANSNDGSDNGLDNIPPLPPQTGGNGDNCNAVLPSANTTGMY